MGKRKAEITETEAITLLNAIEFGFIKLSPELDGDGVLRTWETENGWRITVFDDAGNWDYIDNIVAPDGRVLNWDYFHSWMTELTDWSPSVTSIRTIWKW